MADKILYTNKEELIDDESIPLKNKVTADDMNEIKEVVNSHADDIETLDNQKADRTEIPTDLSELSNENTKFVNETQLANAVNDEKTARQDADNIINNTIATISVDYGKTIELSIDSSTFILTATLKNKNGATLNQSSIDLPIESMIINGRYDSASKKIILILQNGNTIEIPVGDLISGLQSEITPQNKLSSDLVDDTNHTNKFVTQAEKNQIETNKTDIANLDENKENISNKITELTSKSTDTQYPSAKVVYDNESALKEKLDRYKNTIETELGDSTETGTDLTLNGTAEFDVGLEFSGNTSQATSILPSEFTQVDYINNNGGYIDTGLKLTNNSKVEIKLLATQTSSSTSRMVFGARDGANSNNISIHTKQNLVVDFNNSDYTTYRTEYAYSENIPYIIAISKTDRTIYNAEKTMLAQNNTLCEDTFTTTENVCIGYMNPRPSSSFQFGNYNYYYCKIWENDTLVRDFIPCYRNSDNEVGLYDLVNDAFYTNAGTGSFVAGSVSTIPNPEFPQDIQVVKGNNELKIANSDDTQSQTYPITLPTGMEMCKIGDYADEFVYQNNKWYKNEVFEKKLAKDIVKGLTSTTIRFITSTSYSDETYLCLYNNAIQSSTYIQGICYCTHFMHDYYYGTQKVANNIQLGSSLGLCVLKTDFQDANEVNQFFIDNEDTIVLYFARKNPSNVEITDTTLITQLNNIKQAYTYQGQTNLSQTNEDLPFIITADFKLSNLSRIEALESALETVSSRVDLLEE